MQSCNLWNVYRIWEKFNNEWTNVDKMKGSEDVPFDEVSDEVSGGNQKELICVHYYCLCVS